LEDAPHVPLLPPRAGVPVDRFPARWLRQTRVPPPSTVTTEPVAYGWVMR
jgi:hypothetical protein